MSKTNKVADSAAVVATLNVKSNEDVEMGELPKDKQEGQRSNKKTAEEFMDDVISRRYTAPLMLILALAENLPLLLGIIIVYVFTGLNGVKHLDEYIIEVQHEADLVIESKIDSMIDTTIAKMKAIYTHAHATTTSGAVIDELVSDEDFWSQIQFLSFWTESIAMPYHYPMISFTFECNGHVVGTGFSDEAGYDAYIAYYTDMTQAQSNTTVCTPFAANNVNTWEKVYRTEFTDKDGWKVIEGENFTDHGTVSLHDGRSEPIYQKAKSSPLKCAWSSIFVGLDPPHKLSKTVANTMFKDSKVHGMVLSTISVDEINVVISEISASAVGMSMVILEGENLKVIAATEGKNTYTVEMCNNTEVELYTFEQYAVVVEDDNANRYHYLRTYMDEHPEFREEMMNQTGDLSDENTNHYPPVHATMVKTNGDIELIAGIHLSDACGLDYTILMIIDEKQMVQEILAAKEKAHEEIDTTTVQIWTGIALSCTACSILGMMLIKAISKPISVVRRDINRVAELDFNGDIAKQVVFVSEIKNMLDEYMKLKFTLGDFNCFVPPHILDELVDLGDEALERTAVAKDISVLFVYVSNLSAASHNSSADVVSDFCNSFIGSAIDHVTNMNGTTIDFFGDSLFAIFNAPYDDPDYIKNTMECANEILALGARVRGELMAVNPDFSLIEIRIGLHCGSALVGKIGSKSRLKYCAVGDTVNLGSRIENMNRRYNSQMTCSADFLKALDDQAQNYCTRPMEFVKVQGRSEPVLLYEIAGLINSIESSVRQEFSEHTDLFNAVLEKKAAMDEVEAHIKKYGNNAQFIKSAAFDVDEIKEVKKLE